MPNLGSCANFGTIEVRRAPETTDTALTPLTCSSAVAAPRTEEHLVFCSTASGSFQRPGKRPAAFHKFKTSLGRGALLRTEPVSGFRAVSAVSAAPRCARGQCYLKSLGARSCSFAIPKFREESLFGVASAARLLLLVASLLGVTQELVRRRLRLDGWILDAKLLEIRAVL